MEPVTSPTPPESNWGPGSHLAVPVDRREEFLTAVAGMEWVDPLGNHPFMPAKGIDVLLKAHEAEFVVESVTRISYNATWEVPEYEGDPGGATFTILGIKTKTSRWVFVDRGVDIVGVTVLPLEGQPW
jgi:hypothetical protein